MLISLSAWSNVDFQKKSKCKVNIKSVLTLFTLIYVPGVIVHYPSMNVKWNLSLPSTWLHQVCNSHFILTWVLFKVLFVMDEDQFSKSTDLSGCCPEPNIVKVEVVWSDAVSFCCSLTCLMRRVLSSAVFSTGWHWCFNYWPLSSVWFLH